MEMTARLTADAKLFTVKQDKQVVNFDVAINDSYRPKGGEVKKLVTYIRCAYWMNPKIATYLTKGTVVEMQGRISADAYTGKDGEVKASLNFHVSSIKLHGGGKNTIAKPVAIPAATVPDAVDDLPF